MPITNENTVAERLVQLVFRTITSLLLFGLVFELLRPWYRSAAWDLIFVPQLLAISAIAVLMWSVLVRPIVLQWLGYLIIALTLLYMTFAETNQSVIAWLGYLPTQTMNSVYAIMQGGIFQMDDFLRTVLLLIGWMILIVSLQQLVWHFHVSYTLVVLTVVYLLALHFLFAINIYNGLLYVGLYGSLLMALTSYQKRQVLFYMPTFELKELQAKGQYSSTLSSDEPHVSPTSRFANKIYYVGSMTIIFCLLFGSAFALSTTKEKKVELSSWSQSITNRFITDMAAFSTQVSGQPLSQPLNHQSRLASGYSQDDHQLGASIKIKEEPIFLAWSERPVYWRGEAKSTYTGQGWSNGERYLTLHQIKSEEDVVAATTTQFGLKGDLIKQDIEWVTPTAAMPLFHGGIQASILVMEAVNPSRQLTNYIEDEWTSNVYPPTEQSDVRAYTVLTELPIVDEQLLREIEPLDNELAEYVWQHDTLEQYLQLPEDLPVRVTALASEIAGGGLTSRYDKVKAVQQYLQTNYNYSTTSEIPKQGQDFVDHFLFEQQQGYCVHFATSMVVLLRTQEIPARYVKGYLPGDIIDERVNEAGYVEKHFEVGAEDAHAWVEVYFPGVGWVPFEATPHTHLNDEHTGILASIEQWINTLRLDDRIAQTVAFFNQYALFFYIGLALVALLVLTSFSVKMLKESKWYLSVCYKRAYMDVAYIIDKLENEKQTLERSRHEQNRRLTHAMQIKLAKDFKNIIVILEKLADKQLDILEKRINRLCEGHETRRQRVEKLSQFYNQPTIDLLLSVCVWIETIHYSPYKIEEIVHLLPLPKQLAYFSRHIRVDLSLSE